MGLYDVFSVDAAKAKCSLKTKALAADDDVI